MRFSVSLRQCKLLLFPLQPYPYRSSVLSHALAKRSYRRMRPSSSGSSVIAITFISAPHFGHTNGSPS